MNKESREYKERLHRENRNKPKRKIWERQRLRRVYSMATSFILRT